MRKINFYFNRLGVMLMVAAALFATTASAQQACSPFNFTFPQAAGCPDVTLTVEVQLDNGTWTTSLPASYIGRTIPYRTLGAGSCWNWLTVEDKTAPVCNTAPGVPAAAVAASVLGAGYTHIFPAVVITCANAADALDICKTGQFIAPPSSSTATNAKSCGAAVLTGVLHGNASDCSPFEQRYSDVVSNVNCAGATVDGIANVTKKIVRSWFLKDKWGNSSVGCDEHIYIVKPANGAFSANDQNVSCATSLTGFATEPGLGGTLYRPTEGGVAIPNANTATDCQNYASLKAVMILDVCGGGKTYMRTWEVRSKCDNALVTTLNQTVTWKDLANPTGNISVDNYTLNSGATYCFNMGGMILNNQITNRRVLAPVAQALGGAAINVRGIADQSTCLMSRVSFRLSNLDATNCDGFTGAPTVAVSDSRLTLSGGVWSGTFMFANAAETQSFTVTLTDACGNTTTQVVNVTYQDNAAPNAIADAATVQIPAGACSARLNVSSINEVSTDNCGIKFIMFRKMDAAAGTGTTNCWSDVLDYDVADACRTDHMVILRVVDFNNIVSEAMVPVTVNFKPTISCTGFNPIERTCTSNDLLNFRSLFSDPTTGFNSSHPGCLNVTITEDNLASLNLNISCTASNVTRSWKATATYCNAGVTSTLTTTACTQRLNVVPVKGFRVPRIADENVLCADASATIGTAAWIEAEKDRVINGAELLDCNGNKTCAAPVVEVETWEFRSNEYCKIFKVRYTIVDHCVRPIPAYAAPFWGNQVGNCSTVANTWSSGMIQDRVDAIVYERYIYINDRTAPTSTPNPIADICDAATADKDGDACQVGFEYDLSGTDGCTGGTQGTSDPTKLYFMWSFQRSTDGGTTWAEVSTGTSTRVSRNDLPVSATILYRIVYRVTDLCGNMSSEYISSSFRAKDCKAPQILVHNKIGELAGTPGSGNGMLELLYIDIRNNVFDNCDGDLTNDAKVTLEKGGVTTATAPAVTVGTKRVMYGCSERGAQSLRVWAVDASGNWNYVVTTITVQDNIGICAPAPASINGVIANESTTNIDAVAVTARVAGSVVGSSNSATNGSYLIPGLARGANVQVTAAKTVDTDAREGVKTSDIAAISRHLLGSESLNSPYKVIAADVDKNGTVEAADMLQIRRFILFISPSLPAGNFRFVDKAYTFRNAAEPLAEDFPEVVNVTNAQPSSAANFVAVKLGDVNGDYRHVSVRGSRTLTLNATEMDVVAGSEYTVNVSATNFDAAAFQGTFSMNNATVKGIKAGTLSNMSDANFGMVNNNVTASWNGKAAGANEVLAITFVANKSGKLSEMLSFGSALTVAEAVAANGENMNVTLKFNGKATGAEFALYQNTPNPVASATKVGFNLPKDGAARFTVYNAEGKVVFAQNGDFKAGYNEISLNKAQLAAGVLYYRLETADHSATKKMIIIE